MTEDKSSSITLLRRLQTNEDHKRANGVTDDVERRQKPIAVVLRDHLSALAAKGSCAEYLRTIEQRLTKLLRATKASTISDLSEDRILKTLAEWRQRKDDPISLSTSNHYVAAIKGLSRWAWRERILSEDPLARLQRVNADIDLKRVRRPLTTEEFDTLTKVTQTSKKTYRGSDWQFTCTDRVSLYTIAVFTGLRAGEISCLSKASFNFEAMTWTLPPIATKNRKGATLPLHPTLAAHLRVWFAKLNRDTLFPGSWVKKRMAGKMLKRDLKRTDIPYVIGGKFADFHSLRHTFITNLALAEVHPAKAQRLARHSTIALTMNVYTSLNIEDLRDDLGRI